MREIMTKSLINYDKLTKELNPVQKEAVERPINSAVKIVAGAGSGKTKIISKRFVKLTLDMINQIKNPTEHILVITFTDKASGEMKERILKELDNFNIPQNSDNLWISTFHSFCNTILKRHIQEIGMSPSSTLSDEKTRQTLFDTIINKIRYNELHTIKDINKIEQNINIPSSILSPKNINKLKAITNMEGLFIDIWECIKKIKAQGLSPEEFSKKTLSSTKEYSKIISSLPFGFETKEEYQANWQNVLYPYIANNYEIENLFLSTELKNILSKNRSSKANKWTAAPKFPECITPAEILEEQLIKTITFIYAIYQNELKINNMLDFDDLINKTIELFKKSNSIREYYQDFFKHIIIDEFQDTNGAQLELIKLLLNKNAPNITFVGDRKQSIYGFRFAQMENIDTLDKYIKEKYNKTYPELKLKMNYRSTENVLEAVNYLTTEYLQLDETLDFYPNKPQERLVKTAIFENNLDAATQREKEAQYITKEISKLKNENNNYSDFAILVKSHEEANLIQKALEKANIPATKKVNTGFFESAWIKNIIAMFRFIKNSSDEQAIIRLLKIGLSFKEIYLLKNQLKPCIDKDTTLSQAIIQGLEQGKIKNHYIETLFNIKKELTKNTSILDIYYCFLKKLPVYNNFNIQIQNDLIIFEKIILDFMENNYITLPRFLDFIDKIKDDRNFELPKISHKENAVQILTIHASKGLEYPYIFINSIGSASRGDKGSFIFDLQYGNKKGFGIIINKINGITTPKAFLYKEIWQKQRTYEENLRLYYVALSRAEKYLNILDFKGNKGAFYTKNYPHFVEKEYIGEETDEA